MEASDQVIDINQEQLAQILSNAEGAELMDEHGCMIRVTAQQLLEAGLTTESGELVYHGSDDYVTSDVGQYYVINEAEEQDAAVHDAPVLKREVAASGEEDAEDGAHPPTLPLLGRSGSISLEPTEEDMNDVEKLRLLLDECRREMQERDKRIKEVEKNTKLWNRKASLLACAFVKTLNSNNADLYNPATSSSLTKVYVKPFVAGEPVPENAFRVLQENGTCCHVVVESGADPSEEGAPKDAVLLDCDRCPKRFQDGDELKRHVEADHPNKGTFYCRYCEREVFFPNEAGFQTHIRLFHKGTLQHEATAPSDAAVDNAPEEEPNWEALYPDVVEDVSVSSVYKCSICRKEIRGLMDARGHVKDTHGIVDAQRIVSLVKPVTESFVAPSYKCADCPKTFTKKQFMELHRLVHVPEAQRTMYACKFCSKQFIWSENLQKHLLCHEAQGTVKCPDCKQTFSNSTRLDVHYKARHATRGHKYSCTLCMKAFAVQDALTKHMLSHGQWSCDECGKRFADEAFLLRHQATHAAQAHDYVCDVCEKVFVLPANLSIHRNLHTGERPYECDYCGKWFSSRNTWLVHEAAHEIPKPFACPQCDKAFVEKANLDLHMTVHKTSKPYQCTCCKRRYERQEYLELHVTSRKGSRRLHCSKCSLTVSTKWQMRRHLRWHKRKLTCKCVHCKQRFVSVKKLQEHIIRVHVKPEYPTLLIACAKDGQVTCESYENGKIVPVNDLSKYYVKKETEASKQDDDGEPKDTATLEQEEQMQEIADGTAMEQ